MIGRSPRTTHSRSALSLATLLLVLVVALPDPTAAAGGNFYRWRDADGKLVVSDRPPPAGQPYEEVTASGQRRVAPPPSADSETTASAESAVDAGPRDARTCQIARDNLHALETTDMIRSRGPDGEYYFLTEEEKQVQVERARSLIRVHCRGANSGETP